MKVGEVVWGGRYAVAAGGDGGLRPRSPRPHRIGAASPSGGKESAPLPLPVEPPSPSVRRARARDGGPFGVTLGVTLGPGSKREGRR